MVTVHYALEAFQRRGGRQARAQNGPRNFYKYIRDFGFGSRTGTELPGETRGSAASGKQVGIVLNRLHRHWPGSWRNAVQLVSMVSTIANGGVYLPPARADAASQQATHGQAATPQMRSAAALQGGRRFARSAADWAHRVISTLTAAQMRKMMEGVVLFGTGKAAQLNGYSSGGKTGTAQKVDPVTHLYSKTMHVASFAGIAPVNNPVIAVAVIMDNPKARPTTEQQFPRRSSQKSRSRFSNISTFRTTSMCAQA